MGIIMDTFPDINDEEVYNYLVTMFKQYYEYE